MASGDVPSGLILFIAAIAVAGIAAAALTSVVGSMAGELKDRGDGLVAALGTDVAVINDPDNVPYDGGANELTLYVKNTGSETLVEEEMTVFVDGVYSSFTTQLLDGATTWTTGTVAEVTVTANLSAGDHRVRVVHTPNIADDLEFRV